MRPRRIAMYAIALAVVWVSSQPEIADPSTRLLIALGSLSVMFLIGFVEERRQKRENDAKPIISVRAEVTGRRSIMEKRGKYHVRVYYLTFTTQDGSTLEFEVSELEYGRLDDGECGTLEYRGWEYLGLRRYDLGDMEPVVHPERDEKRSAPVESLQTVTEEAPVRKMDGILTHELEE